MSKKVKIKDKSKIICVAIRSAGFNVNTEQTEILLNVVDYIREEKKDHQEQATLMDIIQIKEMVENLFKD